MSLFNLFSKNKKTEMELVLLEEIKRYIRKWDKDDIYAISLYVYDNDDNPFEPTVTLGYNTMEKYKSEIEKALSEREAKWNFAFWLQNNEYKLGEGETQELVKKWMKKKDHRYHSNEELSKMLDIAKEDEKVMKEYYTITEKITSDFIQTLVNIVKELHETGFIKEEFGKEIPIIIHELEYYDQIAKQNIEANSKELLGDFVDFCKIGY